MTVSNGQHSTVNKRSETACADWACRMSSIEYITADGLFSIDLAIVHRRTALEPEFDGPSHFTRNTLEPLGHTRLRDRLLSAMGWQVASMPFFEWDKLHQPGQRDS